MLAIDFHEIAKAFTKFHSIINFHFFLLLLLHFLLTQEQITNMLFNMSGNKKCHQNLAQAETIDFITGIFQTQFHCKYETQPEQMALKKTIKNILHLFARLIYHSALANEVLEHNAIPIFTRVEEDLKFESAYARDLQYINKKLSQIDEHSKVAALLPSTSLSSSSSVSLRAQNRLSMCSDTTVLVSYVWIECYVWIVRSILFNFWEMRE